MIGALRYEITRLRTLRSTWWLLGLSLVITAGIAFTVAWVARTNDLGVEGLAIALAAGSEFSGIPIPAVFAGLVGAFAFGHEYRYGTIRPVLSAVPGRTKLVAAKLLVTSAWALVLTALNVGVAYLTVALVPGHELLDFAVEWEPVGRVVVGLTVIVLIWNLVGLSFAGIFRNLPVAIVLLLVIPLVVEGILSGLLNFVPALEDFSWLSKYLPFSAGNAMVATIDPSEMGGPDFDSATPLQGGLTFGIFGLVLFVICWLLFRKRDA